MSIETDFVFTHQVTYDDTIVVGVAENQPAGRFMSRTDQAADITHNYGQLVPHPTMAGLYKTGENHILTQGSCKLEFVLDPSVSAETIDNYEAWFNGEGQISTIGAELTFVPEEAKYVLTYTTEFSQTAWRQIPMIWAPLSTFASVSTVGDSSTLICFQRIDGNPAAWTIRYRDITAGSTASLEKTGATCYMIFSEDVTKGSQTLSAFKAYKVTSDTLNISAANDTKVIRLSRD